jgi:hypothetical protein
VAAWRSNPNHSALKRGKEFGLRTPPATQHNSDEGGFVKKKAEGEVVGVLGEQTAPVPVLATTFSSADEVHGAAVANRIQAQRGPYDS